MQAEEASTDARYSRKREASNADIEQSLGSPSSVFAETVTQGVQSESHNRRWVGILKCLLRLLILLCTLVVLGLVAAYFSRETIPGDVKIGNRTFLIDTFRTIVTSRKCTE